MAVMQLSGIQCQSTKVTSWTAKSHVQYCVPTSITWRRVKTKATVACVPTPSTLPSLWAPHATLLVIKAPPQSRAMDNRHSGKYPLQVTELKQILHFGKRDWMLWHLWLCTRLTVEDDIFLKLFRCFKPLQHITVYHSRNGVDSFSKVPRK